MFCGKSASVKTRKPSFSRTTAVFGTVVTSKTQPNSAKSNSRSKIKSGSRRTKRHRAKDIPNFPLAIFPAKSLSGIPVYSGNYDSILPVARERKRTPKVFQIDWGVFMNRCIKQFVSNNGLSIEDDQSIQLHLSECIKQMVLGPFFKVMREYQEGTKININTSTHLSEELDDTRYQLAFINFCDYKAPTITVNTQFKPFSSLRSFITKDEIRHAFPLFENSTFRFNRHLHKFLF